jgi:hypothetical protein
MGVIKYTTTNVANTTRVKNFAIGNDTSVEYGPTSTSGLYSTINVPTNGYVIYINKVSNGPSIYVCSTDNEFINVTNRNVAGSVASPTSYTTVQQCIDYYNGQTDKVVLTGDIPSIVTRGLIMYTDASIPASYPRGGTTWTDLSGNGRNVTLVGGPGFSTNDWGYIQWSGDNTEYGTFTSTVLSRNAASFSLWFTAGVDFTPNYANRGCLLSNGNVYNSLIGVWQQYGLEGETDSNGNNFCNLRNNTTLNNGWNNLQTVFSGNTALNYVNGVLVETMPGLISDLTISHVSNSSNLSGNYEDYEGNMSVIQLYNVALTPDEVTQNWNAIKGRYGL